MSGRGGTGGAVRIPQEPQWRHKGRDRRERISWSLPWVRTDCQEQCSRITRRHDQGQGAKWGWRHRCRASRLMENRNRINTRWGWRLIGVFAERLKVFWLNQVDLQGRVQVTWFPFFAFKSHHLEYTIVKDLATNVNPAVGYDMMCDCHISPFFFLKAWDQSAHSAPGSFAPPLWALAASLKVFHSLWAGSESC